MNKVRSLSPALILLTSLYFGISCNENVQRSTEKIQESSKEQITTTVDTKDYIDLQLLLNISAKLVFQSKMKLVSKIDDPNYTITVKALPQKALDISNQKEATSLKIALVTNGKVG